MRYYSIQRPVSPGSYPKKKENEIIEIFNYDDKNYIEEISHEAYGYIDYLYPLSKKDACDYELIPENGKTCNRIC